MKINQNNILSYLKSNKYLVIFIIFVIWMLFFDTNSWLKLIELNQKAEKLEERKEFYNNEIEKDRKALNELENNPDKLEKYARERFLMKKKNEDIYIIKEED